MNPIHQALTVKSLLRQYKSNTFSIQDIRIKALCLFNITISQGELELFLIQPYFQEAEFEEGKFQFTKEYLDENVHVLVDKMAEEHGH